MKCVVNITWATNGCRNVTAKELPRVQNTNTHTHTNIYLNFANNLYSDEISSDSFHPASLTAVREREYLNCNST